MKDKIILGTVQLGLPYGINNITGRPSEQGAFGILEYAMENDIQFLDTADSYGEALDVIGRYNLRSKKKFKIVNKFKINNTSLHGEFLKSLSLLQAPSLYCYMYHQFSDYLNGSLKGELNRLKGSGRIEKIGVSIYHVNQLSQLIEDSEIDVIQVPVNILDLSYEKENLLIEAKNRGKEIHARSVYLQGLFLKDVNSLTGNLQGLEPYLRKLNQLSNSLNTSLKVVALNFVLQKKYIDRVVLGIDHKDQLKENLELVNEKMDCSAFECQKVEVNDEYLLNPSNWKL